MIRIDKEDCRKLPRALRKRTFIDYSNSLERPLWESKLLRFLNVSDGSGDQDSEKEKQAEYNNAGINRFRFLKRNDEKSVRGEDSLPNIARNNSLQMYIVMEQETAL